MPLTRFFYKINLSQNHQCVPAIWHDSNSNAVCIKMEKKRSKPLNIKLCIKTEGGNKNKSQKIEYARKEEL